MQALINQLIDLAKLRKAATPGPWVQWVEHASVYAGPAEENEPWTIRGVRAQIAECSLDADSDMMSDFDQEQGPYDGESNAVFIAAIGGLDFDAVLAAIPAPFTERLPDAFTNAIGMLEHLGREGVAEHLQQAAISFMARVRAVDAGGKTHPEIKVDIERLQEQTSRNKAEQQTILAKFAIEESSDQRMLLAHENGKLDRLNHDYFVRIQALDWVLNGAPVQAISERPVVYHWVDCTHVAAFKEYLAHYHDDQEEALNEYAKEHYQEWLDTAEPGDQYTVSENDHSLDPIEPSFEVVHEDEGEFGTSYQLTFVNAGEAMRFGLGWGGVRAGVIAREEGGLANG